MKHSLIVSRNVQGIDFLRLRYLGRDEWVQTDDPAVAIDALQREPFDRLFCDYWLGKEPKNGRDVTTWLGDHPEVSPQLQVIVTTDYAKKGRQMIMECRRPNATHIPWDLIYALGT